MPPLSNAILTTGLASTASPTAEGTHTNKAKRAPVMRVSPMACSSFRAHISDKAGNTTVITAVTNRSMGKYLILPAKFSAAIEPWASLDARFLSTRV